MLTKAHIKDHRGIPLCNVRTTRSIGIIMEPFSEWRELRQTAQCGKCFARAKKAGWFKAAWIDPQTGDIEPKKTEDPLKELHDPIGFAHEAEKAVSRAHEDFEAENTVKCEKCQDKGFYFEARPLMAGYQLCTCPATVSLVCTKCGHSAYDHGDDARRPGFSKCHKTGCDCDCLALSNKPRVDEPVEVKETESIEEAANNLLDAAEDAFKNLKYHCPANRMTDSEREERRRILKSLESSIEDMKLWLEGIAEANQTPAQMGWVGRNGQP